MSNAFEDEAGNPPATSTFDPESSPRFRRYEHADTIATRFQSQVDAYPDNPAVATESGSLSYRKLGAMTGSIAAQLTALPSHRDVPVCLLMEEGANLVAAMLGALKAGRPFIALDVNFAEGWLSQVIADSGTAYIVSDSNSHALAARLAGANVTVLDAERLVRGNVFNFASPMVLPDDPAFIVYTSGSTGKPKGVVLSHRTAMHTPDTRAELLQLRPADRVANVRSSGVVAGIHNTLLPLLHGACLMPFDLRRRGLHGLTHWLSAQKVSGITLSGSLLRTWLSSLPATLRFPVLRFVIASAEPFYGADVVELARHLEGDWRIMHTLVSTETGIVAAQLFDPSSRIEAGIVPVGQIVAGKAVRLEKEDGTPAGPGEAGEIVVKSPLLALGYWNDPSATKRVFRNDPDGVRICHTGDLGRWRSDGALEHLGRNNRKIKLRGYSVEPYEIECALTALPGVRDAIVTVIDNGQDDIRLAAYVVADGDNSAEAGRALRSALAKSLPAHMVPAHVMILKSFPVTPRGKIDRAALPQPVGLETLHASYRAPSDDIEQALAKIWQNSMKIPQIGVDDDFHALGGTSLQAFLIFAWIASSLGRDLPPTTIMHAPTIAKLAAIVREAARPLQASEKLVVFRTQGSKPPLFVVHGRMGDIMFVRDVVRDLKSDRPVYGLQPPPLDGNHRVPRGMAAIAADYITEIRKVQPEGPYHLAGYSFGGWAAYEMAQQLTREGERVSFVGLIDARRTQPAPTARENVLWWKEKRPLLAAYKTLRRLAIRLPNDLRITLGRSVPYSQRLSVYGRIYKFAARLYEARPYDGHVVIFSSKGGVEAHRSRWGALARGGISIREIPADHREIVWPPYSTMLAEGFNAYLEPAASV